VLRSLRRDLSTAWRVAGLLVAPSLAAGIVTWIGAQLEASMWAAAAVVLFMLLYGSWAHGHALELSTQPRLSIRVEGEEPHKGADQRSWPGLPDGFRPRRSEPNYRASVPPDRYRLSLVAGGDDVSEAIAMMEIDWRGDWQKVRTTAALKNVRRRGNSGICHQGVE
jgi:hypothetical protein